MLDSSDRPCDEELVPRSLKVVADGYDHCIYVLPALVAGRSSS